MHGGHVGEIWSFEVRLLLVADCVIEDLLLEF